jgi:hypothetical protein
VTRLRKMMLEDLQRRDYSQNATRSYLRADELLLTTKVKDAGHYGSYLDKRG